MIKQLLNIIHDIGRIPFLFAAIMSAKPLGFSLGPVDVICYGLLIVTAVYMVFKGVIADKLSLIFIVFIPLSILLAQPNPVFRSELRFVLFLLLFIVASPFNKSIKARQFRSKVIKGVFVCCAVISIASFFCYFLGINMMRNTYSGELMDYYVENKAGTFSGITTQSMLLAPISGIGALACCYAQMKTHKKFFWVLAAMCMGSLLFAASRSALMATLAGIGALFFYFSNKVPRQVRRIITVLVFLLITNPLWNSALEGITEKNQGTEISEGVNVDSRQEKWRIRIEEWKDSPIWGIGFVAVSDRDNYGPTTGVIEPGTSWLAVLSMTGIVGFLLFCRIFYRALKNSLFRRTPEGALLGGALVLVGVHMIAEGHVFSAGSYLCFLVWLIIGCATDYSSELYSSNVKK